MRGVVTRFVCLLDMLIDGSRMKRGQPATA